MILNCSNNDVFIGYKFRTIPLPPPPLPWLHDLVVTLFACLTIVYLLVATIGNVLSIRVFQTPVGAMSSSMSHGFVLIGVTDILVLYVCMLEICLHLFAYFDHCKMISVYMNLWIRKSLFMFGHWLLVLVSVDQTLEIFRPKMGERRISGGKYFCFYLSLLAFTLFVNLPYFFLPVLFYDWVLITFYIFMNTFDNILACAVPFVITFSLNVAMLVKICTRKRRQQKKCQKTEGGRKRETNIQKGEISLSVNNDEINNVNGEGAARMAKSTNCKDGVDCRETAEFEGAIMIISLNMATILFDMPLAVVDFLAVANRDVVYAVMLLNFTRHAFNFIFYFSSKRFRREFLRLLRCYRERASTRDSPLPFRPIDTVTGRLGI